VIVAPWSMIAAEGTADIEISPLTQSVLSSSAKKLLIPIKLQGWDWIGVERWNPDNIVKDVVNAVNQIARGKELKPARRLSTAAIVVIVLVSLCILTQLVPIILVGFGGLSF
jgi:cellulose biosynthesis protein BcsQ